MVKRNPHLLKLKKDYLFPEIEARKVAFKALNPDAHLISLGVGDTTQCIPPSITRALVKAAEDLGNPETYKGYGPEPGLKSLREKIANVLYSEKFSADEVFISDGAGCDLGRLQVLFGGKVSIAVQDPSYPVYVEGSLIQGIKKIHPLPCTPENDFFPSLERLHSVDLIYFCSPHNPTGTAATYSQLEKLVAFAKKKKALILFDAAYAAYVQDPSIPKSIYDIPGAEEVAIEIGSFSKMAGFTGVRLGWTLVPHALCYQDGGSIRADWERIVTTLFNGASFISQKGGLAALDTVGLQEIKDLIDYYLTNAKLLKSYLTEKDIKVFGGEVSPYLWAHFPGKTSWEMFQVLLDQLHLVTIPGSGFGAGGEGFIRFSAFTPRESILLIKQRFNNINYY